MEYKTETRYDGNGQPYDVRIPISSNTPSTTPSTPLARTPLQVLDTNPNIANNPTTRLSTTSTNIPTNTTINPLSPTDLDYAKALDEKRALDALEKDKQVLTEEEYKSEALKSLQAEIDAQNALYAGKLSRAKMEGIDRLGQEGAIQARRGLLGSDFGVASTNKVTQANADIRSSIENELALKLEEIRAGARKSGTEKFEAARKAKQEGLNAYITDLQNRGTLNATIADKIASDYFSKNIDPQSDPNYLDQIAKEAGITSDNILSAYAKQVALKKEADLKLQKEQADLEKVKQETIKTGLEAGRYYEVGGRVYDKNNNFIGNKYEKAGSGGLTDYQSTQTFLNISNKYQADSIVKQAVNGKTAITIADQIIADPSKATSQLASLYLLVKNLDPTSAVREGELALANQTQSYLQKFGNSLTRIGSGRVISPQAAKDLALATKDLAKAWNETANLRTRQYASQANTAGVGSEFSNYLGGYESDFKNIEKSQNKPQQMQLPDGRVLNLQPDGTYQ